MRKFQPRILGKNKKKQGGFTLIELVIVIVIAGILGAAIVATYTDLSGDAREANAEQSVAAINTAIAVFTAETKAPPVAANGEALLTALGSYLTVNDVAVSSTNAITVDGTAAGTLGIVSCTNGVTDSVCAVSYTAPASS
jgi:prepilin-type N-terminal cleavage/methylation domain-containing protein